MRRLTRHQVLLIHDELLTQTGGASGVRDEGMLQAALAAPYAGMEREEFYPTVTGKAARLAFALVNDHPFVDGNKRIGVTAMAVLLSINGYALVATDDDLIEFGLGLAMGEIDAVEAEAWVVRHAVPGDL